MRQAKPDWQQRIARERVEILFGLARKELEKNPARSRRYVELARKIGTRYQVRFPPEMKEGFCKECNSLMVPGRTFTTRIDSKTKSVIIKCGNCNYSHRKRYK
jgi:ribonuclease P protein subunit RPR2